MHALSTNMNDALRRHFLLIMSKAAGCRLNDHVSHR